MFTRAVSGRDFIQALEKLDVPVHSTCTAELKTFPKAQVSRFTLHGVSLFTWQDVQALASFRIILGRESESLQKH